MEERKAKRQEEEVEFLPPAGESKPPFAGIEGEEREAETIPGKLPPEIEVEERVVRAGRVPLHPAVIRLPMSVIGRAGAELTGYEGFHFTESELNDLAELWEQCGIMMSPLIQASIGTTAMIGAKTISYAVWVKAGKPKSETAEPEKEFGFEETSPKE